jgi:FlaA1/EpsC-like NDP-sugar epimerase
MLVVAGDVAVGEDHPGRLALRLWLFSTVYVGVSRMMLLSLRRQTSRSVTLAVPTLILGAGAVGELLARRLATDHR